MKLVRKSIIGKKKAKEGLEYLIVRFPLECKEIIGEEVRFMKLIKINF